MYGQGLSRASNLMDMGIGYESVANQGGKPWVRVMLHASRQDLKIFCRRQFFWLSRNLEPPRSMDIIGYPWFTLW